MSYDLQIWSTQPLNTEGAPPEPAKWLRNGCIWVHERKGWQISVGSSDKVEPEDIPIEVDRALPGISFLTEVNLSHDTGDESPKRLMHRFAVALAEGSHGVVVDPQTDTVTTAKGVLRLQPLGTADRSTVIALSWWLTSGGLVERDVGEVVTALETSFP